MDLQDYIRILHKNWILIVVALLLGVGGGAAASLATAPTYQASTQLFVSVRSETGGAADLTQGSTFARQIVTSYVSIVPTAIVLDPVIEELGLDTTAGALASHITASSPLNTVMLDINVTDRDPQTAADIANAVGRSVSEVAQTALNSSAAEGSSPVTLTIVQPAATPTAPIAPRVPMNLALGAILGLAIGLGIAILRSILDTRIHSMHDIEQITEKPLLGAIAYDPEAASRPLIVHADPRNPRAESFRTLRTNLQFLQVGEGSKAFVVSSAGPSEGKSTTTANLAISLAETGARVALLDGDLRLPKVDQYMGIEGAVGLTDVLIGKVELVDALQRWGRSKLYVLPAGKVPPNPSELLGSDAMDNLLDMLSEHFDYVLIDAPPLLLVTDAALVSKKTKGVLLAAAAAQTKKQALSAAVRTLETAGATLLGVIVTKLPTKGPDSYGYGDTGYGTVGLDQADLESRREGENQARRKSFRK
ncbi:polysaccharide biosynthesis tyrosine autokinase [Microbacterium stercoris]|uniref:non-specific protein-tyrosine kinase n=1 Tax=Microbacterium stercoris TaxID=2820289 RepID=A0A939QKS7_9MICO|nr:polysaccharide biosynthesis tyrosine autokinase [Microbacterium stercoris]MBO3663522.1 polysaccharide biosynthesis tyrosine autokinase [Microbacterium stercoris]